MAYVLGQLVTPQECKFLEKVLTQPTRLEQKKHLMALKYTAQRHKTGLEEASVILEQNKSFVDKLNSSKDYYTSYTLDKFGEVCRVTKDKFGGKFVKKLTPEELDDLKGIPKKSKTRFQKFMDKVKLVLMYIREMFTVY